MKTLSYAIPIHNFVCEKTRQKVLKVAKIKDANYGCKDDGKHDILVDDNRVSSFLANNPNL